MLLQKFDVVAKTQLKKVLKIYAREASKDTASAAKEALDAEQRAKNIEEAKKVSIRCQLAPPRPDITQWLGPPPALSE